MDDEFTGVECPEPVEGLYFVYILVCANGSFYTGHTNCVGSRLARHAAGDGARHTNILKPFKLVYTEGPVEMGEACKRERQLKKWSRAKKRALVEGDKDALRGLSRSRD